MGCLKQNQTIFRAAACGAALSLLAGCMSVGPDYRRPETALPEQWQAPIENPSADAAALAQWWTVFADPALDEVLAAVRTNNLDVAAAAARVEAMAARYGMARADLMPMVDASGAAVWDRQTERVHAAADYPDNPAWLYQAGFGLQWELDVWGRVRRLMESASGLLDASVEDARHLLVMLQASAAADYIALRTAQQQLEFVQENIRLQEETLKLTQGRYEAGLTGELDIHQATMNLAATRAMVPSLLAQVDASLYSLCLLTGRTPGHLEHLRAASTIPAAEQLPGLLPAELLRRRPDIRSAERSLAAQTAKIGAAKADFFPRFSLNGSFAFISTDAAELWKTPAQDFSIGPGINWAIFTAGKVRNAVRMEEALTRAALAEYEQAVLAALGECETALSAHTASAAALVEFQAAVEAARKSVELAETLYRNGLTNFQNVLDMQRQLTQYENSLAQGRGAVAANLVAVYRAFGGGWEEAAAEQPSAQDD